MAYTPTVWKNGEFPPIDAEHLNKIEQGIANSAPGGFGLGESSGRTANGFSDITGYGFYRIPTESGFAPDTSTNWGGVYIGASLSYGTLLYARNNALMAVREVSGGEVGPIEWLNPPMEFGIEYRTTERYLDKPVYVSLRKMGACSAGEFITSNAGLASISKIVSVSGFAEGANVGEGIALPHLYGVPGTNDFVRYSISLSVQLSASGTGDVVIGIGCGAGRSFNSADVLIKYTKTTD